ncbi:MAG: GlsB/YeaQ/YmgE family stress response membrane protein [Candidatus Dormibacteria bacterium]
MDLMPGHILGWTVMGVISGYLASRVVRGRGLGCLLDLVVGLAGAYIGGFLFGAIGLTGPQGFIGSVIVSFVGACALLAAITLLTGRR